MTDEPLPSAAERQATHHPAATPSALGGAAAVSTITAAAATARSAARPRRRHPALGARIAATGLSAATMLGIIAGLGARSLPASTTIQAPSAAPAGLIVIDPQTQAPSQVTVSELSGEAVQLTASPVVRAAQPAPAAPAPVARTNASR